MTSANVSWVSPQALLVRPSPWSGPFSPELRDARLQTAAKAVRAAYGAVAKLTPRQKGQLGMAIIFAFSPATRDLIGFRQICHSRLGAISPPPLSGWLIWRLVSSLVAALMRRQVRREGPEARKPNGPCMNLCSGCGIGAVGGEASRLSRQGSWPSTKAPWRQGNAGHTKANTSQAILPRHSDEPRALRFQEVLPRTSTNEDVR